MSTKTFLDATRCRNMGIAIIRDWRQLQVKERTLAWGRSEGREIDRQEPGGAGSSLRMPSESKKSEGKNPSNYVRVADSGV